MKPRSLEHSQKISQSKKEWWDKQPKTSPDACSVEICDRPAAVKGLCYGHDGRVRKTGELRPEVPFRPIAKKNSARHSDGKGYFFVWVPEGTPGRNANGYMLEHRKVMQEFLGRPLLPAPSETIHHKNGDRQDNRIENLELRVGNHGIGASEAHCQTCACFA